MANKLLLQTLIKGRNGIRDGITKIQDIVAEYSKQGGAKLESNDIAVIQDYFVSEAPSNVSSMSMAEPLVDLAKNPDIFNNFTKKKEGILNVKPNKPFSMAEDLAKRNPGKNFDNDVNFGEVTETLQGNSVNLTETLTENEIKYLNELIGDTGGGQFTSEIMESVPSLKIKGNKISVDKKDINKFSELLDDVYTSDLAPSGPGVNKMPPRLRDANNNLLTRLMRSEDTSLNNKKIFGDFTTKVDTSIKNQFAEDWQELKLEKGPRFFQQEYQGFDSYGDLIQNETMRISNSIVDDLENMGVPDKTIGDILTYSREVGKNNLNNPEAVLSAIKDDLELNNINYDMGFWEDYVSDLLKTTLGE
jgi:hypothetical protein|tara:strand:+ start:123 stop:1205 length:1083 start_codon:yes stop_codon:yes gene_type:complete